MKTNQIFLIVIIIIFLSVKCNQFNESSDYSWPDQIIEHKPGVYWWWMGSAVDKANLEYNMKTLYEAGIGTVHVIPIYGVKGEEENYIDFLSPRWMEMLDFTAEEAKRLGMKVDMSTTTGWPFGGSHVNSENAATKLNFNVDFFSSGQIFNYSVSDDNFLSCMAYSKRGEIINLGEKANRQGVINWIVPEGEWSIYILCLEGTGQKVKRAAPGNVGLVLDPFSKNGLLKYLSRYDSSFKYYPEIKLRAQYHDSYEYFRADWTKKLFTEFIKINSYDLQEYLPKILDIKQVDPRVLADYRRTIGEIHLNYIETWSNWSHSYGWLTRNEAHGAPGNLLDLYTAADIPETETFGSRNFNIPGIRYLNENNSKSEPPNPLILKFASSAANVTGKPLVASEAFTWLRDHYKAALSQIKPQLDELFLSGINHIFYHGNAYSPKDAKWPGWIFYASTHFEIENSIWKNFDELNAYVSRCQSVLQSSRPDNDILLYWPIEDLYHSFTEGLLRQFTVHQIDWFTDSEFGYLADTLYSQGFTFDYISDKQLRGVRSEHGNLYSGGNEYKVLVIPRTKYMPLKTLDKIISLKSKGSKVIFQKSLPENIPGYSNPTDRNKMFKQMLSELGQVTSYGSTKENNNISNDIISSLKDIGVMPEVLNEYGLSFIRKKHGNGNYYFIANLTYDIIDEWIPFGVDFSSALIFDPRYNDRIGVGSIRSANNFQEVYLQLQPGESFILKTFGSDQLKVNDWQYLSQPLDTIDVEGAWRIEFIEGGPELPRSINTDILRSWTEWEDPLLTKFSGTVKYSLNFNLAEINSDEIVLDLGKVYESAEVIINKKKVGCLWSFPYNILAKKYLKFGQNELEFKVTNLSANRIRDLDLNKVDWKKFFFVNVFYKEFDASNWDIIESGLVGPVKLLPVNYLKFKTN